MFYLVFSGGVGNTGPLWIYIVAPVSVFIHGLKRGLIDIAVFITVISCIMFIPDELIVHAQYSTEFKLRLLYSFLTVTFLSSLYEYSRGQSFKHILELSKKYQQLAHFDPLTQLSNRRDALRILKREQARIARSNESLSIIICDIDHFKKVNDRYGHNAGDAVLRELAKLFTDSIREQDCVARWGGEEFLFILPQTLAVNANIIAEKIQNQLKHYVISYEDKSIKVTVSMGISQFTAEQSIDEVINRADKFLYQAKDSGRNQIFPKFENIT
ncbi:GGDEF domain-containing protein [Colwellia echini]|uniref:diguanylate cyclase n=2 Tax=Colwellia echini TaxID=1982103 RepID=A0ABY3N1R9_9GAMM|nr:GGDEF domain-containing protein [Colwellia echini]